MPWRRFADTIDAERPIERPELMVSFDELNRLMGIDELEAMGERYG
jgi:hypothetical protein